MHRNALLALATSLAMTSTCWQSGVLVAAEDDVAGVEFFEKEIRPLLVKRCYECHGPAAKRLEGGLLMNSRESLLEGGDTDAAIVPGKPDESLLIDAITYEGDYEMPPKGKMPDEEIALLTKWVEMGAPWPAGASDAPDPRKKFDLAERKATHWAWQPIADPAAPVVKQKDWPLDPIDNFILAKLEDQGLSPSGPANATALLRRLYFDIIGLPPSEDEVALWTARLTAPQREARKGDGKTNALPAGSRLNDAAIEELVDELLASKHFGERWGRHWLDLMRYAESRGHEFDAESPNAWEYRDYVIRALNADVPYDQFVTEHVAGDILAKPRRHPEDGFNESIIATGFWHLGEWVHSPVDIRQDECDRLDNQIDVFSKTFLGMTVACARCHDHKFDAISQRDYYALAGYVQSSAYRLARFETLDHNREIAQQLHDLRQNSGCEIAKLTAQSQRPVIEKLDQYLLAAREALITPVADDGQASTDEEATDLQSPIVFADFEDGTYGNWKVEGAALGDKPVTGTLPRQQNVSGFHGKFYINTYIGGDDPQGTAVSPTFKIQHPFITMLVGGGSFAGETCMNLIVDGQAVRTIAGKNNERLDPANWDVRDLIGKEARLEIVDRRGGGWGHINVDHIVFTNDVEGAAAENIATLPRKHIAAIARRRGLDANVLTAWVTHLAVAKDDANEPTQMWATLAHDKIDGEQRVLHVIEPIEDAISKRALAIKESLAGAEVIIDYGAIQDEPWMTDGSAFGVAPTRIGDPQLTNNEKSPLAGFATYGAAQRDAAFRNLKLAPGAMNDAGGVGNWQRVGQSVGTPTFTVKEGPVHYLVRGAGRAFAVVDSHRLIQGPLHGETLFQWKDDNKGQLRWVTQNLTRHQGHRVHVEFSPHGGGDLEILMVVQGARPATVPVDTCGVSGLFVHFPEADDLSHDAMARAYQGMFRDVNVELAKGSIFDDSSPVAMATIADWMVKHPTLFVASDSAMSEKLAAAGQRYVAEERKLAAQVKNESRVAQAMWDGYPEDEQLLIRGNHGTTGGLVPRHTLTALGGTADDSQALKFGSGRLQLAEKMVDPANPLTSRVMVNRIWHHLTGRGIAPITDNFGVLGMEPTHPELLDHLATRFMREGWSVKRMIKAIVLSRTYQMSSHPTDAMEEKDPSNQWLHRMRIRRLEGETIRDAMLAISGRLDENMYGHPVPVYLTPFMTGRGRPGKSGPIDGDGRRSIYISIRRNFLSPMMLAFDMPQPSAPVGRRTVSNVPAQALIMMNDPLVVQQAELWAKRLLIVGDLTPQQRIEKMYRQAFAREPSDVETADALAFLVEQGARYGIAEEQATTAQQPWTDLCHVMFNVKEFIFVN